MSDVFSSVVKRQLRIERFIESLSLDLIKKCQTGDRQIIRLLTDFTDNAGARDLASLQRGGVGSALGRTLVKALTGVVADQSKSITESLTETLPDLSERESRYMSELMELKKSPPSESTSPIFIAANVNLLFNRHRVRLFSHLMNAAAEGKDLVKTVRGTKQYQRKDGIFVQRDQHLKATTDVLVHKAVMDTRKKVYKVSGVSMVRWLATLDLRTCPTCASRDGQLFELNHSPNHPHPKCRCIIIPNTANIERPAVSDERSVKDIPPSERKDKITRTKVSFKEWFDGLDKEDQRDWLGKTRFDLYRKGRLTIDQMIAGDGRLLRLDEL